MWDVGDLIKKLGLKKDGTYTADAVESFVKLAYAQGQEDQKRWNEYQKKEDEFERQHGPRWI